MPEKLTRTDYEVRLSRVATYIYDHLEEPLDLLKLAEVACLSPYHWHRIYQAAYGESAAQTVKRLRMHRAADYLVNTDKPIERIAELTGYTTVQSFTRIFKAQFGLPPAQYRSQGSHMKFQLNLDNPASSEFSVTVQRVEPPPVYAAEHRGPLMNIGEAFDTLFRYFAAHGLIGAQTRMFGVFPDDPSSVEESELRSFAAVTYDGQQSAPFTKLTPRAGDYAVLRHKGPYANMRDAYTWFFGTWLVNSGREADDAPVVEEYLNNPRDTAPTELLTDLYLPLR